MAKTTKSVVPIRSVQKFNKSNTVNSITLVGATDLADIDIDCQGDVLLNLNHDNTKIDKVETTSELITVRKYGTKISIGLDQQKLVELIDGRVNQYKKGS